MKLAVKVPIIESERGWGQKTDDYMILLSNEDAKSFILEFNSKNTDKTVPDWYMYADNSIKPVDITDDQYDHIMAQENKREWLSKLQKI